MRKKLLLKSLLVAAMISVGGNAWAEDVTLTPTADTEFNWTNDETKATSYGGATTLNCGIWQEMWTNATPGLKGSTSRLAVLKFDVSSYKGKLTAATLKVTGTNPSTNTNTRSIYLGYFMSTSWDETTTASSSGMNTRSATDLNIGTFSCSNAIAKGETKEVSFSNNDFLTYLNSDEDGIVSLIIYGVGQGCYINSKEAESGKPQLVLSYSNETLYTASFTEANSLEPTVNIFSDEERTESVTNGTLTDGTTYYYTASLAGYADYKGSFTVSGADPSINFTMTKLARYTFTVNAVDESSKIVKALYTDEDSYEGKVHNIVYSKYLTGEGNLVTYTKNDNTYGNSFVAQAKNETIEVGYTSYEGVAYFIEVEDVVSATEYGSWNCSNGIAVRGFTTEKDIFTVPATGIYDITYAACNNNVNYDMAVTLSKNATEIAKKEDFKTVSINYIKSTGIVTYNNISLGKEDIIKMTPSTTNAIIDYMLIELKSVPATVTAAGWATLYTNCPLDFSGVEGLTAYTATLDGSTVTLTEVADVPANTGVVLKGEANTYEIPAIASSETAKGDLEGSATAINVEEDTENVYYVLAKSGDDDARFAKVTSGTIAAGKAYLKVAKGAAGVRESYSIGGVAPTAIESVQALQLDGELFNLNGQRVAAPQKGLYIVNGKKVIMK